MQQEVAPKPAIHLRIWGARGSMPTPIADNLGHGGNTSCIQILAPDSPDIFLFDAGTGIHALGRLLAQDPTTPRHIHIFFTHFHWDHIQGLPGFAPLFAPQNTLTFYSSHPPQHLRNVLHGQMRAPFFPVDFETLLATRNFVQIHPQGLTIPAAPGTDALRIDPIELHHPGGATGYRISQGNSVIVYATDHEHGNPAADARLLTAAANANTLIYDAQFTPETYATHTGWGHSTWLEATRLANAANVQNLILFHHDPTHNDTALETITQQAQTHFPQTTAARELHP